VHAERFEGAKLATRKREPMGAERAERARERREHRAEGRTPSEPRAFVGRDDDEHDDDRGEQR
jgi:hypothetical protein